MRDHPHLNEKMRACLIDWLAELHHKFKMWTETLFVCISIVDRYLANETHTKKE